MNITASASASVSQATSQRLLSLDALRGFDMFWIIGADSIGHALAHVHAGPVLAFVATQLDHVAWEGFRFYDLIFPLFAFMIGVATTFSIPKIIATAGNGAAFKRIWTRAALLYLLGLFYYGGFSTPIDHIRYVGVLQRLAIAYAGAATLFLLLKPRGLIAAVAAILLGYWALLAWTPIKDIRVTPEAMAARAAAEGQADLATAFRTSKNISIDTNPQLMAYARAAYAATPGTVRGHYEPGYNLANHIDFRFLPGKNWDGFYDPEGLLSNLTAIASALLGVLAGLRLRRTDISATSRAGQLAVAGLLAVVVGYAWGMQFPIVKKIWSSSFVLVAGGYSALLLATFYWMIDIRGWQRWCTPFIWIGANPLTIYLVSRLVDFDGLSARFVGGDIARAFDRLHGGLGDLAIALTGALLCILLCRFLYQRQIFLRL